MIIGDEYLVLRSLAGRLCPVLEAREGGLSVL